MNNVHCIFYYSTTCQDSADSFYLTSNCVRHIILNDKTAVFFTTPLLAQDSPESFYLTGGMLSGIFEIQAKVTRFLLRHYLTKTLRSLFFYFYLYPLPKFGMITLSYQFIYLKEF